MIIPHVPIANSLISTIRAFIWTLATVIGTSCTDCVLHIADTLLSTTIVVCTAMDDSYEVRTKYGRNNCNAASVPHQPSTIQAFHDIDFQESEASVQTDIAGPRNGMKHQDLVHVTGTWEVETSFTQARSAKDDPSQVAQDRDVWRRLGLTGWYLEVPRGVTPHLALLDICFRSAWPRWTNCVDEKEREECRIQNRKASSSSHDAICLLLTCPEMKIEGINFENQP